MIVKSVKFFAIFLYIFIAKSMLFFYTDPTFFGYTAQYYWGKAAHYILLLLMVFFLFRKELINASKDRKKLDFILNFIEIITVTILFSYIVDYLIDNYYGHLY